MAQPVEKYPIGIQSFSKIRRDNYIYVDKTALIYKLAQEGNYYFLARPRRFGKSLLLSTLKAYFEGEKELFEGLAISKLEKEWKAGPVLMLTLARYNKTAVGSLENILNLQFEEWEREYDIQTISADYSVRFSTIIRQAYEKTGERVAILIDEYDAPMVAHLGEDENHSRVKNLLKSIYVNLKEMDQYIRFGLLTGVSRFSRTSVFSGLNNLNDITLDSRYAEICGITEQELKSYFQQGIKRLSEKEGTDYAGALSELKASYDGYHFTENSADVYNPFSVLNALEKSKIEMYWFQTGTPTFLIETIRNSGKFLPEYFTSEVDNTELSEIDTFRTSPIAMMFQTGYLTIKEYDCYDKTYTLGIPNREVKEGLSRCLLVAYMSTDENDTMKTLRNIRRLFMRGQVDEALERIKIFLSGIPYELANGKDEIYFENNLYLLFNLIGVRAHAEYHTSRGRIDLLLDMPEYVYVMELKLDGTPYEALEQIKTKGYADQFKGEGKEVIAIGINFSRETRNIDTWLIERV